MPARWTRPPKTAARTDAGRNHDLFEALLKFAGRADITDDHVVAYARQMYARIDKLRPHAFTARELHGITMSVLRYRDQWRDRGWHKTAWLEHQRAAAAKNPREKQRAKGRLGGLRSGQARRSRTHDRDQRILEALAAGESTRSVAAAEGLSHVAVYLIGRRLTGVKRSHHTDVTWSRWFGQLEGLVKVYSDCEITPSSSSAPALTGGCHGWHEAGSYPVIDDDDALWNCGNLAAGAQAWAAALAREISNGLWAPASPPSGFSATVSGRPQAGQVHIAGWDMVLGPLMR